jgi:Cu+-exporting ATPase
MRQNTDKDEEKQVFEITGMSCASCAARIERTLANTEGVLSANVNLATHKATVTYDPTQITPAALAEEIKNLGYGVALDKLELVITGMHCASCVRRVEQALENSPGVVNATVNLATGRTTVTYAPYETSAARIIQTIKDTGYEAARIDAAKDRGSQPDRAEKGREQEIRSHFRSFLISAVFSLPLMSWLSVG